MAVDWPANIYLHFLDRELRLSVGSSPTESDILFGIFTATCLAPGRLFCAYSHLWESAALLADGMSLLETMVSSGVLVPASDYLSADEFLASRQTLYEHDARRYPFYFELAGPTPTNIQPSYRTSLGATRFLQSYLSQPLAAAVLASSANRVDDICRVLDTGLIQREGRAITGTLFTDIAESDTAVLAVVRRAISYGYASHYLSECGADISTSFKGLSVYDALSSAFPLYDIQLFDYLLNVAGRKRWRNSSPLVLLERAIAVRDTPEHAMFVAGWRSLVSSCRRSANRAAAQPAVGTIAAELARRSAKAKPKPAKGFVLEELGYIVHILRLAGGADECEGPLVGGTMEEQERKALILVATDREWDALNEIRANHGLVMRAYPLAQLASWDMGRAYGWHVFAVRSEMGTQGAGATTLVAEEALRRIAPDVVLMPGIAFGLKQDEQQLEDLLVSRWVVDYETCKVTPTGIFERGPRYEASVELLSKARLQAAGDKRVHFGEVICGCKLVNRRDIVSGLRQRFPEAIGGEMEGIGLASACHRRKVDWLLVKGICDWGFDKDDKHQLAAAKRAVAFCFDIVQHVVWESKSR